MIFCSVHAAVMLSAVSGSYWLGWAARIVLLRQIRRLQPVLAGRFGFDVTLISAGQVNCAGNWCLG